MKVPNRSVEYFPYERRNAEKLIELAKKAAATRREFNSFVTDLQTSGREPLDFEVEDRIAFGPALWNFEDCFTDLIASTFPELLPIEWETAS